MGKGICADSFVGDREKQEQFRLFYGGSAILPIDIAKRLDRQKHRKKNNARADCGQKVKITAEVF